MSIADMFADMDTAQGSNSGVFFTQGNYHVALKEIEFRPNGYKGKSVIFRFKVTESNNQAHPVGSTRVWICKLDKKPDENKRTMSDIKDMVFALIGTSRKEVGSAEANPEAHKSATAAFVASIDPDYAKREDLDPNALLNLECALECISIPTKATAKYPNGGEYTRHVWEPLPSQ